MFFRRWFFNSIKDLHKYAFEEKCGGVLIKDASSQMDDCEMGFSEKFIATSVAINIVYKDINFEC